MSHLQINANKWQEGVGTVPFMERNGLEQKRHATIRNLEVSNNESDRDFERCHGYMDRYVLLNI